MANINDNYTFSADTGVISRLDDNPNESDLDAAGLKAAFDAGATNVVNQINSDLIPAINARCDEVKSYVDTEAEGLSGDIGDLRTDLNSLTTTVNTKTADTGWREISVSSWTYVKYRKIGNKVIVKARTDNYKYNGNSYKNISTLPEGYRPLEQHYYMAATNGRSLARIVFNPDGTFGVDWGVQITNGDYRTDSSAWIAFQYEFYVD